MSVKIGVVVPMRNCLVYTQRALASLHTRYEHRFFIIDDHSDAATKCWLAEQSEFVVFTDPAGSTGLAWNWNLGISAALNDGCTHVLVINNDILLHREAIDTMVSRLDQGDVILVSGDDIAPRVQAPEDVFTWQPDESNESYYADYSCFMVVSKTIERVGWFDEEFTGAYFEDNDYTALIIRAGARSARLGAAPHYHYHMRTSVENPSGRPLFEQRAARNSVLFQHKWGRMPATSPEEISRTYYEHAYNAPSPATDVASARLDAMYRSARGPGSAESIYSSPLYQLASLVNSIAILGTVAEADLCAVACARPRQLRIFGSVSRVMQERITAAARFAGVELVLEEEGGIQAFTEPIDLLLISEAAPHRLTDITRCTDNTRQYVVVCAPASSRAIADDPLENEVWSGISAHVRKHWTWRLHSFGAAELACAVLKRID